MHQIAPFKKISRESAYAPEPPKQTRGFDRYALQGALRHANTLTFTKIF